MTLVKARNVKKFNEINNFLVYIKLYKLCFSYIYIYVISQHFYVVKSYDKVIRGINCPIIPNARIYLLFLLKFAAFVIEI